MDFVSVRDLKVNTGQVWEKLDKERELVVTSNGRPIALMTGIVGNDLEVVLAAVRRARGEWAIRQIQESARKRGLDKMSMEEIDEEIRRARRDRRR